MRIFLIILLGALVGGCSYSPNEVVTHDNITSTKKDMKPLTGVVKSRLLYGEYVDGKKVGTHQAWHNNGQLLEEGNWIEGKKDGIHKKWNKSGQLLNEETWKDGKEDGIHRKWRNNGTLQWEIQYHRGKLNPEYKSIKIGKLEVMAVDLGQMNWFEAKKACTELGDGWRLPTNEELNILYKNKDKIGNFINLDYWSSSEHINQIVWCQNFYSGDRYYDSGDSELYVRAVRTI